MNMKTKALLLLLCAVAVVAAAAFGTLAYLTDAEAVTNTFAVGRVGLTLDEAKVDANGTPVTPAERVNGNTYHLLPGHTYVKDPTVTMDADSEDAYVRMIVTVKNINDLKAALPTSEIVYGDDGTTAAVVNPDNEKYYGNDGTFLLQMLCGGWDANTWQFKNYTEKADGTEGYYEFRYKEVVKKSATATELDALFETITVPGEIDNAHLAHLAKVKINVTAHAIQAAGFDSADAAWKAFDAQTSPNS